MDALIYYAKGKKVYWLKLQLRKNWKQYSNYDLPGNHQENLKNADECYQIVTGTNHHLLAPLQSFFDR